MRQVRVEQKSSEITKYPIISSPRISRHVTFSSKVLKIAETYRQHELPLPRLD